MVLEINELFEKVRAEKSEVLGAAMDKAIPVQRPDKKVPVLCTRLRELALRYGPDGKLPTVSELCIELDTSRATLNEALGIAEAQNVIYRRNGRGIYASPKLFRTSVGILFNNSWLAKGDPSPFWGKLWGLIAQEAHERSCIRDVDYHMHLLLQTSMQNQVLPQEISTLIETGRLKAVLATGLNVDTTEWITSQGVPCVTFAGGGNGTWGVGLDYVELLRLGVASLAQQGCQRIGLWVPYSQSDSNKHTKTEFDEYFQYFLADHVLPFDPQLVRTYTDCPEPDATVQELGYQLVHQVFVEHQTNRPDGIVIMSDLMTDGALAALLSLGVSLGDDVKIATHANAGLMCLFRSLKGVTVIEFDIAELVQTLFSRLDLLIVDQKPKEQLLLVKPRRYTSL